MIDHLTMKRLVRHVETSRAAPFGWSSADCLTMCLGIVDIVAGCNLVDEYRGTYENRFGALRRLMKEGHSGLDGFLESLPHLAPVPAGEMRVFDLAVGHDADGGQHLGFCGGPWIETKTESGPLHIPPGRVSSVCRIRPASL